MTKKPRIVATTKLKRTEGEWRVKAYDQHGKRFKKADYFTDTKSDAECTAVEMCRAGAELLRSTERKFDLSKWSDFREYVAQVLMVSARTKHLLRLRELVADLDYEGPPICGGIYQSLHAEWEDILTVMEDQDAEDWDWSFLQDWAMNSHSGLCPKAVASEILHLF